MKDVFAAWHRRFSEFWPTTSLRAYLVAMILLATVPVASLMSYQLYSEVDNQTSRLGNDLQRNAAGLAQAVERELASTIDVLTVLSYSASVQSGDVAGFELALAAGPQLRPSWSGAFLVDLDGQVLFDTAQPGAARPEHRGSKPEFRRVLAERTGVVSNLITDRTDRPTTTVVEVPVIVNGTLRYVLGATIDSTVWQGLIAKAGVLPEGGFGNLYDREYRVVASTQAPERHVGKTLPPSVVASMAGRPAGLHRAQLLDASPSYRAWQNVTLGNWGVAVGIDAGPLDAAHDQAIVAALGTVGGCLLLGVALALLFARRVTGPLQQLATHGAAGPFGPIVVREIALLRDALLAAAAQDAAAHDRLRRKADEFETLFNGSPIGLAFAQDAQCRAVLHNAAMNALFGPPLGPGPTSVQVLYRGEPLDAQEQPLQRAAARGEAVAPMDLELIVEGRPPMFVLAHAVPLRDAAGRPRGAIGAVVDITERKRAEARLLNADRRLRESQHLVDLAQEAGHVGFFHYQFEGDVLAWTPGLVKLFGIETEEFESTLEEWVWRIEREDRVHVEQALRRMLAAHQEKETIEFRVTLPDGSARWLSNRVLLSYAEDGRPQQMVGVTVDMTDQKQVERERAALVEHEQAARFAAEAANRAKDEFLAMLGHELRNPLSAIASAVEVLNRVDSHATTAIDARRIIERQTRHLAHMMDDLLDVTRVIAGKILLSRHGVDLAALVRRVTGTLEMTGQTRQHTLDMQLDEAWIDADGTRIEQVVNNLLTNALKYTPAGGRIEVRVRHDGGEVLLEVSDTGVGIPAALLPRIFDLFVQGERTLDRRAGGLGVGLTLVRRLVELHGGTIGAQSSPAGSTFSVRLPAIEAPEGARETRGVPPSRRRRVTLIEDNDDALNALRSMLELDGHTVSTATDGISGLASVLQLRPDVAVVDIGLPGLTGFDVARRSRAAGYAGRMIALSGYGQGRDVQQALQAGFDAHLVKPVDADQLRRLLAED